MWSFKNCTRMWTLSVSSASLTSFRHNVPKNFNKSYVLAFSVLSTSAARSQFQPLKQRNFSTAKTTSNLSGSWMTAVGENVQSSPVPTSVPVRVAHELLQAGHRYLDVRTPEEFDAGHAAGAVNVPYMFRLGSGMTKNPDFVEEVLAKFGKDDEIIVGCQLGKRSLMAATDLIYAGFTGITDIAGGYASWVQNELPTET